MKEKEGDKETLTKASGWVGLYVCIPLCAFVCSILLTAFLPALECLTVLYSVKYEDLNNLLFHTRGFVRMVPFEYWAQMLMLASIMEQDIQMGCDEEGFLWVRSVSNDFRRPPPSFPPAEYYNNSTKENEQVEGVCEIDIGGSLVCAHRVHHA